MAGSDNGNGAKLQGGLSNDMITMLLGKGRTRNGYAPKIEIFLNSDEPAVDVAETWPVEFSQKNATTLYQGFRNAADKMGVLDAVISVKQDEGHVYLWHNERVQTRMAELAEAK